MKYFLTTDQKVAAPPLGGVKFDLATLWRGPARYAISKTDVRPAPAFGSYGWAKGGAKDVEKYLKAMKFDIIRESIQAQFVPTSDVLNQCRRAGTMLAQVARKGVND